MPYGHNQKRVKSKSEMQAEALMTPGERAGLRRYKQHEQAMQAAIERAKTTLPMWRWNKEDEGDIHKRQYHEWQLTKCSPEAWEFKCLRCKDTHALKALA